MIDVKEFVHEQVFLEVPAFPRSPEFDSEWKLNTAKRFLD
jgi:hypothetical protein